MPITKIRRRFRHSKFGLQHSLVISGSLDLIISKVSPPGIEPGLRPRRVACSRHARTKPRNRRPEDQIKTNSLFLCLFICSLQKEPAVGFAPTSTALRVQCLSCRATSPGRGAGFEPCGLVSISFAFPGAPVNRSAGGVNPAPRSQSACRSTPQTASSFINSSECWREVKTDPVQASMISFHHRHSGRRGIRTHKPFRPRQAASSAPLAPSVQRVGRWESNPTSLFPRRTRLPLIYMNSEHQQYPRVESNHQLVRGGLAAHHRIAVAEAGFEPAWTAMRPCWKPTRTPQ